MGVAVLMAVLVAVLVVACWSTVRDHVEAWHFQLTRETETTQPPLEGGLRGDSRGTSWTSYPGSSPGTRGATPLLISVVAEELHCAIIFDRADMPEVELLLHGEGNMLGRLEKSGWRVLEQRFPRRAYVLIRAADRPLESSPLMWDGVDLPVPTE